MKIYQFVRRVPGGLILVPLFIGMLIDTFVPDLLKMGGFTQALAGAGYPTVPGMDLLTVGTKMTVRVSYAPLRCDALPRPLGEIGGRCLAR